MMTLKFFVLFLAASTLTRNSHALFDSCYEGNCYDSTILSTKKNWGYVKDECNKKGGHVFSFGSQGEVDHVLSLVSSVTSSTALMYIGATAGPNDLTYKGKEIVQDEKAAVWEWKDGTSVDVTLINSLYVNSPTVSSAGGAFCWMMYLGGSKKGRIQRKGCATTSKAFVCKTPEVKTDYCYEVRWANSAEDAKLNKWAGRKVLSPVTRYPLKHPKVVTGNCGKSIDGQIHPTDKWSESGKTDASDASCKDEEGGDVFYGYLGPSYKGSTWKQSSSNTGFSVQEGVSMFFVIDSDANGYWVVTVDTPGNSKLGEDSQVFSMSLSGTGIAGKGVRIIRKDDDLNTIIPPGETCLSAEADCYDWDPEAGSGTFLWKWDPCCTDGMVVGKLPSNDFCVDVTVDQYKGLNKMAIGDYVVENRDIDLIEVPLAKDAPVQVCGYTCTDFCSTKTSCGECSAHAQCGWCGGTSKCEPKGIEGACPSGWVGNKACCEECTAVKSGACSDCLLIDGCAFNAGTGECYSGDRGSGFTCKSDPPENVCYDDSGCDAAPGKVWIGKCYTKAPTPAPTDPTASPTTPAPTTSPTTRTPTSRPTGPTNSPTRAPTKPSAPACAFEYDCGVVSSTVFENATCYNATDFQGYDFANYDDVCLCDFRNCTGGAAGLILGMEPAVFGGVAGGVGAILVAAALCCACGARRRRRKKDAEDGIEVAELPWTSNPMRRESSKGDASPLINDLKKLKGQKVEICTNNPRLASMIGQYSRRVNTMEEAPVNDNSTKNLRAVVNAKKIGLRWKKKAQQSAWSAHTDPSTKRTYYYNRMTQESVWVKPEGYDGSNEATVRKWKFLPNEEKDLPELLKFFNKNVWKKYFDENTNRNYYVNKATKEAVWLAPIQTKKHLLTPKSKKNLHH